MQAIHSALIQQLHQHAKSRQIQKAIIGLSGGLDSAVALCLAKRAFGAKNVTALILPEMGVTPQIDIDHAKTLVDHFGCKSHYQPINNFLVDYHFLSWESSGNAHSQMKARVRANLLHHFRDTDKALILGTANKSDLKLGYGHPDGEFTGDLQVLGELYKSDVLELAKHIGLPDELLTKTPSRELHMGQSDEGELGASWQKIDQVLRQFEKGHDPATLIDKGMDALLVHKLSRLVQENKGLSKKILTLHAGELKESINKARAVEASSLS